MLNIRTEFEILSDAISALSEAGVITDTNPGSIARTFAEIFSREMGIHYSSLKLNTMMGFVSLASGTFLDLMGEILGVFRVGEANATVQRTDQNIKFYTSDGSTLITHQPSGSIPAGTTISSADGEVEYTVRNTTALPAFATEVFVGADAEVSGTAGNVGARTLTVHNLSSANILVVNQNDIGTGTVEEDDDNFRFRIANSTLDYAKANMASIRMAALNIPGVADVSVQDYRSGTGTFDVLIIPVGNTVPASTLRAVQSAVNSAKAVGTLATIRQPSYIPIQITVRLTQTGRLTSGIFASVRTRVVDRILNYIGEIALGGTFVLNELRQRVMETDPGLLDMEVLCYIFRSRPQLLRNFQADSDELFLPDPTVSSPIKTV